MKRPAAVRILGKQYALTFASGDHPELNHGEFAGRIDHNKLTITVDDGNALGQEQDTVLHEVVHGVEHAMHLELDEAVVHRVATGLLAVMKDNPLLVEYLMENTH